MLEQIIQFDQELFLQLNNLGSETWDRFWLIVTNKKTWIPFYVLIAFFLYKNLGWKKTLLIVACIGIGVGLADQITNFLKEDWVKRLRPCYTPEIADQLRLVKDTCGGKFGFTSAHSSNHFVIAIFLGLLFYQKQKRILLVLLFWAALIAYSRVYIGVHFPLDIFFGSLLGIVIGRLMLFVYRFTSNKHDWFNA